MSNREDVSEKLTRLMDYTKASLLKTKLVENEGDG